jgi:hypothetical protein
MTTINRREQVRRGPHPRDDRYITLTSHRILATNVLVVAVTDGTNRLADPPSLLVTTNLTRARRHANKLYESWGGGCGDAPTADYLPPSSRRASDYPDHERPASLRYAGPPIVRVLPPERGPRGRWRVERFHANRPKPITRRFASEPEAHSYYQQLITRMEQS